MFDQLLPDDILSAVTAQGFYPTGYFYALNSFENRVYEVRVEDHEPLIIKFYRPGRWTMEAIQEEHLFLKKCHEMEVPVVPPLSLRASELETLGLWKGFPYAIFNKFRGRAHDEITNDDRKWMSRTLGRLHNIGAHCKIKNRITLNSQTYGWEQIPAILSQKHLPPDMKPSFEILLHQSLKLVESFFQKITFENIPLHGDCHPSNILWNEGGPMLIDFDDMVLAPAVQDLWMLFYGDNEEQKAQRDIFFQGYEPFRKFDYATLGLIEPLRTLRMIRHAAWVGARFEEEIFKKAFSYYAERRYWEGFLQDLRMQISLLQEM